MGVKYGAILPASEQMLKAELLKLEQQLSTLHFEMIRAMEKLSLLIFQKLDSDMVLTPPENLKAAAIKRSLPYIPLPKR